MAVKPITVGDQFQGGRVTAQEANIGPTLIRYVDNTDLGTDTLQFQFPAAAATGLTFGQVRSVFIDNAYNDYSMTVVVGGTQHTFPVPANSTGYYLLDSQGGSDVSVASDGNPAGPVEFIFYNFERTPIVWYKFGASTTAVTIADGADVALGSIADAAVTDPTDPGTAIAILKGLLSVLDSGGSGPGNLVRSADGGLATIGDTSDAAETNPADPATVVALLKGLLTEALLQVTALNNIDADATTIATNTGNSATSLANIDVDTTTIATNTGNTAASVETVVTNTNAFSYNNINTSTTTDVKNAPGTLGKVTVNSAGGAGSIIVYDNTAGSGPIIATLDSTVVGSFDYNVLATTGITVVTTGAPDITVTYK